MNESLSIAWDCVKVFETENHIKVYKIVYKCTRLLDGIAFSGTAFSRETQWNCVQTQIFIPVILFLAIKGG